MQDRLVASSKVLPVKKGTSNPAFSACLPCQPACFVSLPALPACLLCQPACFVSLSACFVSLPALFVATTGALVLLKWIFLQTNML
jgi:hypothetical protein